MMKIYRRQTLFVNIFDNVCKTMKFATLLTQVIWNNSFPFTICNKLAEVTKTQFFPEISIDFPVK